MDIIDEQLKNLSDAEFPSGIHQSVMRAVNYERTKPVLFVVLSLLVLNFAIIAWHINTKLIDAEFTEMLGDLMTEFSFSFSFMSMILGDLFAIISPEIFLSNILSLVGIIYVVKRIKIFGFKSIIHNNI